MTETWRSIPGFEGYEVSDQGRVRSWKAHRGTPVPRMLTTYVRKRTGYLYVTLSVRPRIRASLPHCVHQLVITAFVGTRPDGLQVRHLNGDATDSRLSNLAYGTPAENRQDTIRHGRDYQSNKTHCKNGHPYDEANTYFRPRKRGRQCITCRRASQARAARARAA